MRSSGRGFLSIVVSLILIATAALSAAMVVRSGVLAAEASGGSAAAAPPVAAQPEALQSGEGAIQVTGAFQVSQPRDPFRPLVTEDSPVGPLPPGVGGPPGSGGDGDGFTPIGATVTLVDIRRVGDVLRATVEVNGTSYDVGVGDTFAGSYKVVSLSETKGVFMFGDNAFELTVGQQILK
jgi:hypothetical protein